MNDLETKRAIEDALKSFGAVPLAPAAIALFESLGYKSQKRLALKPNTPDNFLATFAKQKPLNSDHALLAEWQSVDFLFQITDEEVRAAAQGSQQFLFDSKDKWNGAAMESYLFIAITLANPHYTRSELSGITRAVNRLFPMPVMLLFRHGDTLTLAVINRRLHKRDESRDVLEKVTLIKDIRFASPHRAHVEILCDLSFDALREKHDFTNFVALHTAWQKTLDSSELNKRFFQEIANWYFWALDHIEFPKDAPKQDGKDHISVIRLITRLMFCWFVKEKGLIPDGLFDSRKLPQTLNGFAPDNARDKGSVFYRSILQNLFFATLNTEMDKRGWTKEEQNFMAHSLYRFRECFQKPADALDLFKNIPFLNGGLFECLDKREGTKESPKDTRIDGFTRRADSQPVVPDFLFFGSEKEGEAVGLDWQEIYGRRPSITKVRGLIHTFDHYKFTVAENTPIEEEIALDPELSGKVFENLLAAYNPETGATARKQTGSFYTPREIVNYMVDEALIACLKTKLEAALPSAKDVEPRLRQLSAYNDQPHQFTPPEVDALIAAIDALKSLDPAVGSGAFPMGILHKLVFILGKLDARNEKWKERQIARVRDAMAAAEKIEDATIRERAVRELEQQITGINEAFEHNELDYGRKLYLIENCIYGVDIQPIAVQIAKMRFFISLIVDQKIDDSQPNRGVRPLPNLETKFVAANTLFGVERKERQGDFLTEDTAAHQKLKELRQQLAIVRHRHFLARTPASKAKCRDQDRELREKMSGLLQAAGLSAAHSRQLASWNPYDQNATAGFFDPEWMFGVADGFNITIGNPPYVRHEMFSDDKPRLSREFGQFYGGTTDLFAYFYRKGLLFLCMGGVLSLISSNKFLRAGYGKKLRELLAAEATLLQIVDFGELPVFAAATDTAIVTVRNEKAGRGHGVRTAVMKDAQEIMDLAAVVPERFAIRPQDTLENDGWVLEASSILNLLAKLRRVGKPLNEVVSGRFYYGIKTGLNEAFIVDRATHDELVAEHPSSAEVLKPFVHGADAKKWTVDLRDDWLIYVPWHFPLHLDGSESGPSKAAEALFQKSYPAIYKHLLRYKPDLLKRNAAETGIRYEWYALQRWGAEYWREFEKPKIIFNETSKELHAFLDETGLYTNKTLFMLVAPQPKPLLAVLLSRTLDWLFRHEFPSWGDPWKGGRVQFRGDRMNTIPIPDFPAPVASKLSALVDRILATKKKNADADTSTLEAEIDQHVYALYGLTPEEIKIVEEATK